MRNIIFFFVTILVIASTIIFTLPDDKVKEKKEAYVIVIHAGAGTIDKSLPDSVVKEYYKSLSKALQIGNDILKNGESSLDAVEQVVRFLEDDPKFNAGKGAVFTSEGTHELDASIMDGKDLSNGAVTLVRTVKNPVSLARLVMEKSPHVLIGGKGAEDFAKQMNVEIVPNHYFDTDLRLQQLRKIKEDKKVKGTVGAVALDMNGNLAAATSTGGMSNKMPGRIGDSPLINAGTYANNKTCAVSGTGTGELFITHTVAYRISALIEYKGLNLKDASDEVIHRLLKPGDGGIIAVDKDGNYTMTFNTSGMFRGVAASSGIFEVKIWE